MLIKKAQVALLLCFSRPLLHVATAVDDIFVDDDIPFYDDFIVDDNDNGFDFEVQYENTHYDYTFTNQSLSMESPPTQTSPTPKIPSDELLSSSKTKPNLIMIVTDEHNLRTLGCYREYFDKLAKNLNLSQNQTQSMIWGSNNVVETPHIDSLAREGVLFTNFYTVSPLCTPSRASFMSGLYPQFTGLPMIKQNNGRMDDKVVTFAETLQKQGNYSTAYLGKWHLDGDTKPGWRSDSSPKRQFGFQDNKFAFNRGHWKYLAEVDGDMKAYTFNDREQFKDKEEENFTTDYLFDRSIEIIKQNQKKAERQPFVHVISIPDPHGPNQVRQPYQKKYKDMSFELPYSAKAGLRKDPAVPAWVRTFGSIGDGVPLNEVDEYIKEYESRSFFQNSMQQYFGMVKCIDDNVGKLLQYLKATGIDNETIIVFTSDHGDLLGEHAKMNKGNPYRTSAGIPFILRYPAKVKPGKIVKSATTSVDFAPTILSLMGLQRPKKESHGFNVAYEVLSNKSVINNGRVRYMFDAGKNVEWAAAFRNQYKVIISAKDVPWLFDLDKDPNELINYFDHPDYLKIREQLLKKLAKAIKEFRIPLVKKHKHLLWSTPICLDSNDRVSLSTSSSSTVATCSDLGVSISLNNCSQQHWKQACPVTCGNCCKDSEGSIWIKGLLKTCMEIPNSSCTNSKIGSFCPQKCGKCTTGEAI